jgi:hypothetical protein
MTPEALGEFTGPRLAAVTKLGSEAERAFVARIGCDALHHLKSLYAEPVYERAILRDRHELRWVRNVFEVIHEVARLLGGQWSAVAAREETRRAAAIREVGTAGAD